MKRFSVALLLTLALAAGCREDNPIGPEDRTGSLSFAYTGERTGTFVANGELRLGTDNTILGNDWAAALRDTGGLTLVAFRGGSTSNPRGALFVANLGNPTQPGTISLTCTGSVQCPQAGVVFNTLPTSPTAETDSTFAVLSGTVVIDTLTTTRVAGRFDGIAQYAGNNGGTADPTRLLVLANGRFSLPIRTDLE